MSGFKFDIIPNKVPTVNTKFRTIKTMLPVPESLPILADLDKYESVSMHGQLPVVWDRAEDFQVYDAWGNKWIDFTSTIFVTNAGHGNKRIIKAIRDLINKPLLHTYTYASQERADYLKYLIENTPAQFEKAFLLSSGSEATEACLKLMRMKGWEKGKKKPIIIAFEGNWHGRTLGAQMMGYNPAQKEWIGYLDPNIYHLPFPFPWRKEAMENPAKYFRTSVETFLKEMKLNPETDIAGIMMETFQGWGAVCYPAEFVKEVETFARKNSIVFAFDEMQAGFGRTGKLFGYMHYGVEPDLLACGKGASSGVPLSIVLGSKEIMDLPEIGSMSSTHSANPLVCVVGKANLQALIEDGLIEKAKEQGKLFHKKLNELKIKFPKHLKYVLGMGMVAGLVFQEDNGKPLVDLCNRVSELAMRKGLLVVHTGRESIKLAPPLTIPDDALMEGIAVFEECLKECI